MSLKFLQISVSVALLLTLAVLGLRLMYTFLVPIHPFDPFNTCGDYLCWNNIQLGITPMDEADDLLIEAGIDDFVVFDGEFIYAGLGMTLNPNTEAGYNDTFVTSDSQLIASTVSMRYDICSHDILAQWGKPDEIWQYAYGERNFIYFYESGENTIIFRSEEQNSIFDVVLFMSPAGYDLFSQRSIYNYNPVRWHDAEPILKMQCTTASPPPVG
jgi:hypothetical protein